MGTKLTEAESDSYIRETVHQMTYVLRDRAEKYADDDETRVAFLYRTANFFYECVNDAFEEAEETV